MAPTPALWALLRCTCSPVASRIPSFTDIERCENDAMRSSFQPEGGEGAEEKRELKKKKKDSKSKSQYRSSHSIQAK